MAERWIIDPVEEDAGNIELDLLDPPFHVTAVSTPTPAIDPRWAQPADADGDRLVATRYLNRQITAAVEIVSTAGAGASAAAQAALARLADKVAKINREGGTLLRELPSGDVLTFDLLTAEPLDPPWDVDWAVASVVRVELRFTARPFARGAEQARFVHAEPTLPALVFTEGSIPGDVPALGRLVVTAGDEADQAWCIWGVQSATYDAAATSALLYQAESRTPLGSAVVATTSGASGGASNNSVRQSTLSTSWAGILSTRSSGGADLTHVGDYRVFARVYRHPAVPIGAISIALEWALGDFGAFIRNAPVESSVDDAGGSFEIADLGIVSIPGGTSRWEGRVVAKSTLPSDGLSIDYLMLVPTERSGEVATSQRIVNPVSYTGLDDFSVGSGDLIGNTATVGGNWDSGGDANDFFVRDAAAQRTAIEDIYTTGPLGRWAVLPPVKTRTVVRTDFNFSAAPVDQNSTYIGVVARFTDIDNYVGATYDPSGSMGMAGALWVVARVSGSPTLLGVRYFFPQPPANAWYTIQLLVDDRGQWSAWFGPQGPLPALPTLSGKSPYLATGGLLEDGKDGLFDWWFTDTASTRKYDNFAAWVPTFDAAMFAERQLAVQHDGIVREDLDATLWSPVSRYAGDLLTVPPSGPEGRAARFIVKGSRGVPGEAADAAIDDLSAQLHLTPRWLVVP